MVASPVPSAVARLGGALSALASPVRLALLHEIRSPKTLQEIHLPAERGYAGAGTERPLSRQAVRHHLDQLIDVGVVLALEGQRAGGPVVEYVVNHQALFAISEDFRALAHLRPVAEPASPTARSSAPQEPLDVDVPCLVLVKGLDEGTTFLLAGAPSVRRSWVVGRKRSADIVLDFDPFVSSENAIVTWDGSAHAIEDVPGSANGTTWNFRPLARGERRVLRTGDLVGVGHSILMFRA